MIIKTNESKEDVLYAFSVEPNQNSETLSEYLKRYPLWQKELIDLSIVLLTSLPKEELSEVIGESKAINNAWNAFQSKLSTSDPVFAAPQVVNPLINLQREEFRLLATKLGVNTLFLAKLRDKTVTLSTIPNKFIEQISHVLDESIESVRTALDGTATISTSASFKADKKPIAEEKISFDDAIEFSNLTDEQKIVLRSIKD